MSNDAPDTRCWQPVRDGERCRVTDRHGIARSMIWSRAERVWRGTMMVGGEPMAFGLPPADVTAIERG